MTKRCKGCGALLQNENKNEIGYTPKMDADYCQRCYRLSHYGDVMISMQQGIEANQTLEKINQIDGTVFWVVDLFNFEESLISRLNQKLPGKKIVLVGTKRDLLPDTLTDAKLREFVYDRLDEEGILVDDLIFTSYLNANYEETQDSLALLKQAMDYHRNKGNAIFMGVANAGKSTIINRLLQSDQLTTSRHPGTTVDVVEIDADGYKIYDTPGIENPHSVLTFIDKKDLKTIIPAATINPIVFQIRQNQSFAVGGLCRLDVYTNKKATVVAYFARSLDVHRGKLENADAFWNAHLGKDLLPAIETSLDKMQLHTAPKLKKGEKMDVVIEGLGWFCVSGEVDKMQIYTPKDVYVVFRKITI